MCIRAGGVALAASIVLGCSRTHYRLRADREATEIVNGASSNERWKLCNLSIYGDPRARFYEATDPDNPPMPPDDPYAWRFMEYVDGKRGAKLWNKVPRAGDVVNPEWNELLPTYTRQTADGKLVLDLPSAIMLARIHSPSYQRNLEEIYLAALDVAFERFRFDVQFFAGTTGGALVRGNEPPAVIGRTGPGGETDSFTALSLVSTASAQKQFAAGGELLAGFANSIVWQFAGPNTNFTTSLLDFSLVQPLLRGGGRVVAMEQLTRVERNLLSNLRAQSMFLQDFYRDVAIGQEDDIRPRRIGGFQGGAGLSGFTGTGQGGFGGVGAGQNFGGFDSGGGVGGSGAGGGAGLAGGGEGNLSGFYGLIQRLQAIRNTEASLAAQQATLGLLEANFDAGLIDLVQVDEFRQNIETERSSLLQSQVNFRIQLEAYLIESLGLPPHLGIELDDSLIAPLKLTSTEINANQNATTEILRALGALPPNPSFDALKRHRDEIARYITYCNDEVKRVRDEFAVLEANASAKQTEQDLTPDPADVVDDMKRVRRNLDDLTSRTELNQKELAEVDALFAPGKERDALYELVALARKVSGELQELALFQARVRLENVTVQGVALSSDDALAIARQHRMDWMSQRAALVDQWRLIAFNANRLLSTVDFALEGDVGTLHDNGLAFRGPTGGLRGRLIFDAPITRKSEQNLYRESLINYQRAKRSYIQFRDRVELSLRSRLSQMRRLEENLDIQKRALIIAIRRVDLSLDELNRPFKPPAAGQLPAQLGPTLAQNLLRALSDFRNTQDNLLSVWFSYQAARMNLMFELGIMQIDENGMWIDEPIDSALARLAEMSPNCPPVEVLPDEAPDAWETIVEPEPAAATPANDGGTVAGPVLISAESTLERLDDEIAAKPTGSDGTLDSKAPARRKRADALSVSKAPLVKSAGEPKKSLLERLPFVSKPESKPETIAPIKLEPDPIETAVAEKVGFIRNLQLVAKLEGEGCDAAEIVKRTRLSEGEVKAYLESIRRVRSKTTGSEMSSFPDTPAAQNKGAVQQYPTRPD